MKKFFMVIASLLIVAGCYGSPNNHKSTLDASTVRETNERSRAELVLIWELVDVRTKDVVATIDARDLGYQRGNGLDEQKVIQLAKQLAKGIDQPLINPTITREGEIKEGRKRVILSERELVDRIMTLSYYNKRLVLPIYEEDPKISIEDLRVIKHSKISSYVTSFNPKVVGRSENIKLSSESIDHYVLGPDEVFSFNKVVGQRTAERGYQEALEIVNQEFVMGIGGGICQTSSTLFNAVDKAGLEIVERYSHSRDIGYVPPNRDATVSWGGPDFKFKNSFNFPILISAEVNLQTGKIEVIIYASQLPEL